MSYEVLARKWRPQSFADLVGQTHVVKALTYALSHQQIHHAYLFTGTRGVGKTSIARIFAKSLNCEVNGVSATPCGQCTTCQEITAGKFVDLIEVDAASRTGVEETRELIDSVAYLPSKGRYKVYLIDEVHMFSKSSFNALLKTLEEPPEHVKFILATTDPEKLPITILSRCLQFNLKSLTPAQIRQHLANICSASDVHYDEEALGLLASAGDGSMRDTLSMTDQAIAYGHGELRLSAVTEILGTIQPNDIEAILFAIATNNPNQLSQALHRLDDYEVDARAFLIEVMRRLQRMAWAKEGIVDNLSPKLLSTVNDLPKELLHLWYDIAEKALPNLNIAGEPRQAVEMALLRMLAFIPNDWIVRHRTPLDVPTTDPEPAPPIAHEHTEPAKTFAEQVQALPVTTHDSLAAAEAEFSGEPLPEEMPKAEEKLPPSEASESQAPVLANQETPVQTNIPQNTGANEITDNNWQLSAESDDNAPPPSMDDVRAMMQSGREISAPNAAEVEHSMPIGATSTPPEANSHDTPPWEIIPDTESAVELKETIADTTEHAASASIEHTATTEANKPLQTQPIAVEEAPATSATSAPTADIEHFDWYETIKALSLSEYTYHMASIGILTIEKQDNYLQATLLISPKHQPMLTEEGLQELNHALENRFAIPINLQTELASIDTLTPSDRDKAHSEKQQSDLLDTFRQEPITQKVLSLFDGQIIEKTVKPTDDKPTE